MQKVGQTSATQLLAVLLGGRVGSCVGVACRLQTCQLAVATASGPHTVTA
jgi:hypothetical protein